MTTRAVIYGGVEAKADVEVARSNAKLAASKVKPRAA